MSDRIRWTDIKTETDPVADFMVKFNAACAELRASNERAIAELEAAFRRAEARTRK